MGGLQSWFEARRFQRLLLQIHVFVRKKEKNPALILQSY